MDVIKIDNLYKSFGEVKAVSDISFKVKKGELFAFLGQNGAGKSTTINIICGRLNKDSGSVYVDGETLDDSGFSIKRKLGVVFQNSVLDKPLSVLDNLKSRASLYGIEKEEFDKRIEELDKLFDFKGLLNRTVGKLSGGQRRKIDIVRALIHRPKILILDEPTTGLDPQTRKNLWDVITDLRKNEGMTVFLTTHYMEEAAEADYIVILDSGKICAEGKPIDLKNAYTGDCIYIYNVDESEVKKLNKPYSKVAGGFKIELKNIQEATALITEYSEIFNDYEVIKGKMDDVFLSVTGKNLQGGK